MRQAQHRFAARRPRVAAAAAAKTYVGGLSGEGRRFGVVVGRFNDLVTKLLLEGCKESFARHGVSDSDVDVSGGGGRGRGAQASLPPP